MKLRALLLTACGAFALISCESSGSRVDYASAPHHDKPVVMNEGLALDEPSVPVMIAHGNNVTSANANVDIYNLDGGTMATSSQVSPSYDRGVMPVVSDPSVTIFPLDGVQPMASASRAFPASSYQLSNPAIGYVSSYGAPSGAQESIYFNFGSSRLGSKDMQRISSAAQEAKFAPVNRITVAGHASKPTQVGTDTIDAHILNLKESMNRSFEVSKTLMRKGVPAEKIKAVSWGATKSSGVEEQDRRVDIIMGEQ